MVYFINLYQFLPAGENSVLLNFELKADNSQFFSFTIPPTYLKVDYDRFDRIMRSAITSILTNQASLLLKDGIKLDVDHSLGYKVVNGQGLLVFASQHKVIKPREEKKIKFLN